ncbi:non-SMC mitotic condensation complex subunit 1 [Pilobolus umbonatus]|nr:non-SMC mitotic condensation complex subunit 1 [Pilobolus umbonatus]
MNNTQLAGYSPANNPLIPRNQLYTCISCEVAFPTTDKQRAHYRTDWHKYNLKRKIAQLPSITAEQFAQKVLAQQAKGKELEEKQGLIYECVICRKSYGSENGFSNHLLSRRHKELESLADKMNLASPKITHSKVSPLFSDAEDELTDTELHSDISTTEHHTKDSCLFCGQINGDFTTNLNHMVKEHGFFLPDVEYLEDAPGLVDYLGDKIDDCICLYCNGRGRQWQSREAVRKHMLDKGHCKMAYDDSEDPEELLRYYNFGTMSEQDFEAAIVDTTTNESDELILDSGNRVCHRKFMKYYKQKIRRSQPDNGDPLAITESATPDLPEPRNRKERRNRLAITDGSLTEAEMLSRLPIAVQQRQNHRLTSRKIFELSEELLKLQEGGAVNYYIPNETDIRGKSDIDLARYLNDITDSVEESSGNIVDSLVFDKIRSFIKYFPFVQPRIASRLFDIVLAAFRVEIKTTYNDLEKNTKETYNTHKQVLEMYGFLVHWFLTVIEEANVTKTHNKKNKHTEDKEWDWIPQKIKAYDSSSWLLEMRLSRIWTLTPERVKFVNLFTKSIYQLFENPLNTKSAKIKERAFRILSICIKNYDHLFVAQTTIMQNLQYWEHSAETMAELLVYMAEKQDYTQLADEILREIGNREFKDVTKEVKDSPNPKTFTLFLQKLAELSHKIILKNMAMLIHQLDSESYLMRMCILDILGGMIAELAETAEENPIQLEQINKYFDCLEERTLDSIAYCRQKVFQVYIRLFE